MLMKEYFYGRHISFGPTMIRHLHFTTEGMNFMGIAIVEPDLRASAIDQRRIWRNRDKMAIRVGWSSAPIDISACLVP
jgi:hypothetical protein